MRKSFQHVLAVATLSVVAVAPAWSSGLMDSLKGQAVQSLGGGQAAQPATGLGALGGGAGALGSALGLPSIGGGTASNAAGVLQYCIQNKYLGASGAAGVKDKLLSQVGLGSPQAQQKDTGYQQGLGGLLTGSDGASFDLGKIKSDLKEKACDYVLDNASALL